MTMDYALIKSLSDTEQIADYFKKSKVIGLDTETTGLSTRIGNDSRLRLIQISDGVKTAVIDVWEILKKESRFDYTDDENSYLWVALKELLEDTNIKKVIHYAQFDCKWFKHALNAEVEPLFDTFIISKLLDFSQPRHSLSAVARKYLRIDLDKTEQKSDWSRPQLTKEQYDYAALDPYYLPKLREVMFERLETDRLLEAAKIDLESIAPISSSENYGIFLDTKFYENEIEQLIELHKEASENLQKLLRGTKPNQGVQMSLFGVEEQNYNDVKISSHQQVQEALFALGIPVVMGNQTELIEEFEKKREFYVVGTGKKQLAPLESKYKEIKYLNDFRGVDKMVTTYGEKILSQVETHPNGDTRLHTTFQVIGAPTGRMSSNHPNIQQVPDKIVRVGEKEYPLKFREAFTFPKGRVGISADYSQIELRILAEWSKCPVFCGAFKDLKDLHALTASMVFDKDYELCKEEGHEFYKVYRKKSKQVNFGIAYGTGSRGLASLIMSTEEEAEEIIQKHRETHPVLWSFLDTQAKKAMRTFQARTMSGRLQRFKEPEKDERGFYKGAELSAIGRNGKNMPIQGCLDGEVKIAVKDVGYVNLEVAPKGSQTVWDGEKWVQAFVTESGDKELCILELMSGLKIKCSPDHKFWTKRKVWKSAKDLTPKDKVEVNFHSPDFNYVGEGFELLNEFFTYHFGILSAFYFKRGEINGNVLTIKISESNSALNSVFERIINEVGLTYSKDVCYTAIGTEVVYSIEDSRLVSDLKKLDISEGLSKNHWLSKNYLLGLLGTLVEFSKIESDKNIKITLGRGHEKLVRDLQEAFLLTGVNSKIKSTLLDVYLLFEKFDAYRVYRVIGCLTKGTISKLKKFRRYQTNKEIFVKVKSFTKTGEKVPMYDVVDSESHCFMAGGVSVHNTSADIMKIALRRIYDALKGFDAHIVNIIHDEVLVECDASIQEEVRVIVEESMREAGEIYLKYVPVSVDAKVVNSWGDK